MRFIPELLLSELSARCQELCHISVTTIVLESCGSRRKACGRVGVLPASIVAGAIIGMRLGLQISFLFYVIPAVAGALMAFLFVG